MLRRIMRRAILQGSTRWGSTPGFLDQFADVVTELMGAEYRELHAQRDSIHKWLHAEEAGFGRTLAQGPKLLDELIDRAIATGAEGISAADAFLLHDTYGFPIDLTLELVAEHDLGVDEEGFEALMDEQRDRSRAGGRGRRRARSCASARRALAGARGLRDRFRRLRVDRARDHGRARSSADNGRVLVKLVESPFYATGGGQVADSGLGRVRRRRLPGARRRRRATRR